MATHDIVWTKPAPFWSETTEAASPALDQLEFQRPAILRFATDTFMDDFMNVIATDPKRLGEYRARRETWRGFVDGNSAPVTPAKAFALAFQRLGYARRNVVNGRPAQPTKPPVDPSAPASTAPMKLFQPAHQRYYLITSCLVCRTPGLPDRKVDAATQQRVGFLMRRTFASEPGKEFAWVRAGSGFVWRALEGDALGKLADGEEVLPMFAVNFTADDLRQRRLFASLIPAGKREAYLGAPQAAANTETPAQSLKTARKILFRKEISEPWKALLKRNSEVSRELANDTKRDGQSQSDFDAQKARVRDEMRRQITTTSLLILHDFLRFLKQYIPRVYDAIVGTAGAPPPINQEPALLTLLQSIQLGTNLTTVSPRPSLRQALASMKTLLDNGKLETITGDYVPVPEDGPPLTFPLADPIFPMDAPVPTSAPTGADAAEIGDEPSAPPGPALVPTNPNPANVDLITAAVIKALDPDSPTPAPAIPPSAIASVDPRSGIFVIRCVYERPTCGPLHKDIVSQPSEPFELAGFFDPDAPARPIRIGLPIDTTPAGLRKFDKNTAFVISDVLCGQMKRFKGMTLLDLIRSVLPFPLHKPLSVPDTGPCVNSSGGGIGMICSLSIPIITICALILLMIMVSLLDFIFRWIPFFIMCFPLPKLTAKPPP